MIRANELRIGNYVMTGNIKSIVLEIFASGITHDSINGNIVAGHCEWSHINPIPLTEDWLLKFGFVAIQNGWYGLNINPITITWNIYDKSLRSMGYGFNHIAYVHQLQNLYWCLCGQELQLQNL